MTANFSASKEAKIGFSSIVIFKMLVFFDETFRDSLKYPNVSLGALCGIAIPERELHRVATDVFQLKRKHLGSEFANDGEIKGRNLLKNWVFKQAAKGIPSRNLQLVEDLLNYIVAKQLFIFGCVCFERGIQRFRCEDVHSLDTTFRYVFERIDMFMKIRFPDRMAKIVFDDRDYGINQKNSRAITNFFQRSSLGLSFNSIIHAPFFAISQAQNVGLQLADIVTAVVGLRFSSHPSAEKYFQILKKAQFSYQLPNGYWMNSLKIIRGQTEAKAEEKEGEKGNALDDRLVLGRDK